MTDLFARLASSTLGEGSTLRPQRPTRFETERSDTHQAPSDAIVPTTSAAPNEGEPRRPPLEREQSSPPGPTASRQSNQRVDPARPPEQVLLRADQDVPLVVEQPNPTKLVEALKNRQPSERSRAQDDQPLLKPQAQTPARFGEDNRAVEQDADRTNQASERRGRRTRTPGERPQEQNSQHLLLPRQEPQQSEEQQGTRTLTEPSCQTESGRQEAHSEASSPPSVQVTIDHIEVRTPPEQPTQPASPQPWHSAPMLSLDDYLGGRRGDHR